MIDKESLVFERNIYYESKLLTANDFIMEQSYFLNKRKFINGLVYCGGIISGLGVKKVDGDVFSVSVLPGAAVDYNGREIIIKDAETVTLDRKVGTSKDIAFLCLEYAEKQNEKTFAAFRAKGDQQQYNKLTETFKLYWDDLDEGVDELTLRDKLNGDELYWKREVIYSGDFFIISQCVPLYAMANRFFEIRVELVRLDSGEDDRKIAFSYSMTADNIVGYEDEKEIKVSFSEKNHVKAIEYSAFAQAFATENLNQVETLTILKESFKVEIDGVAIPGVPSASEWKISRVDNDIRNYLRNRYLEREAGKWVGNESYKLYLAKVYLHASGDRYAIREVRGVPFGQYLDSWQLNGILQGILPSLSFNREMLTEAAVKRIVDEYRNEVMKSVDMILQMLTFVPETTSGILTVAVDYKKITYARARSKIIEKLIVEGKLNPALSRLERSKLIELLHRCDRHAAGQYTEEPELLDLFNDIGTFKIDGISHGLGKGQVELSCAVISDTGTQTILNAKTVITADTDKGQFSVSGCLLERYDISSVQIRWRASKKSGDSDLSISPRIAKTTAGTGVSLICCSNGKAVAPDWTVSSAAGVVKDDVFIATAAGLYVVNASYGGFKTNAVYVVE